MPEKDRTFRSSEHGFMLFGALLLVAITAVGVGLAMTVVTRSLDSDFSDETSEEMELITRACYRFYEDMGAFPASIADLVTKPTGSKGWLGPYLKKTIQIDEDTGLDLTCDAWGSPYVLDIITDSVARARSFGPNGTDDSASGDDLSTMVQVNALLYSKTNWELRHLRTSIAAYNSANPGTQLPTNWSAALDLIQAQGFIPSGTVSKTRFLADSWNQSYVPQGAPTVYSVNSSGDPDSSQ